jgi:hypothetical protein
MGENKSVDDQAIVALIAGIVSVMFALFACRGPLHFLCLPAGIIAVTSGVAVLKEGKGGRGLAVAGVVLGTMGICAWILMKAALVFLAVWRWLF